MTELHDESARSRSTDFAAAKNRRRRRPNDGEHAKGSRHVAAIAVLQIVTDAELELDLEPAELKLRLELYLRDEFADLARRIAADREDCS
jgi:hypothetical protein